MIAEARVVNVILRRIRRVVGSPLHHRQRAALERRGARAEAQGDWQAAVIIYFDGLRMGRHLTHQSTLLEALANLAKSND